MEELKDPCIGCLLEGKCNPEEGPCEFKEDYNNKVAQLNKQIEEASVRTHEILVIKRKRSFDPAENDDSKVELNEGYEFKVDAAIPEIADGIAKMAIEMDKMPELDKDSGMMFLTLIAQFYKKLKEGGS